MVSSKSGWRLQFGNCVFDGEARSLTRAGRVVSLSPKAFALLQALLVARPRALSSRELHDRLWPGTYVTHTSLPRVVAEVRKAMGDRRREARFVRTVHGFGYAFCGEATLAPSQASAATDPPRAWAWCGRRARSTFREGEALIGRGRDCVVRIDLPEISRHHARIRVAGEAATIEDLGSKNGTCVGGRPRVGPDRPPRRGRDRGRLGGPRVPEQGLRPLDPNGPDPELRSIPPKPRGPG